MNSTTALKNILSIGIFYLFLIIVSCASDKSSNPAANEEDMQQSGDSITLNIDDKEIVLVDTFKVKEAAPIAVESPPTTEDQLTKSIFYDLGCCQDQETQTDDCCCKAIITKYSELRKSNDKTQIAQIKTKDPLFGACVQLKKWKTLLEEIDNPEEEELPFDF
jgi:hypothetical protein